MKLKYMIILGVMINFTINLAESFSPTGLVNISYVKFNEAGNGFDGISNGNAGTRIRYLVNSEFREGTFVELRYTDHHTDSEDQYYRARRTDDELRLKVFQRHTDLITSRIQVHDVRKYNYEIQSLGYGLVLKLRPYGIRNDYIRTRKLDVVFEFAQWQMSDGYSWNTQAIEVLTYFTLPSEIGLVVNGYILHEKDSGYSYSAEIYLYKIIPLMKHNGFELEFNLEGGLDNYFSGSISKFKYVGVRRKNETSSTYLYPRLTLKKSVFYTDIGWEYRNFIQVERMKHTTSDKWEAQFVASVGIMYEF